jgi:hypothetical protein
MYGYVQCNKLTSRPKKYAKYVANNAFGKYAVLEVGRDEADGIPFLFEKPRNHPSAF